MKHRVLFVDDDLNILHGMRRNLRALKDSVELEFAENAIEALRKMSENPFDVVISDMRMPGMNGAQFLEDTKARYPQVVRIVLSGHSEESMILRSLGSAHQYLAKPCSSEAVRRVIKRVCKIQEDLSDKRLKEVIGGLSVLPSLPSLYTQLLNELQDEDGSLDRVSDIIGQDGAMCAKMLQLVNSAFFGLARPIADPKMAVQHLGFETVKSLALVVKAFEAFPPGLHEGFSMNQFWEHSMHVGLLALKICQEEGGDRGLLDQVMTAGMLHDIGKLILVSRVPDTFEEIQGWKREHRGSDEEAEREKLGVTHAQLGGYLLGIWGLPPGVVEAVQYHHCPGRIDWEQFAPLTAVHVANGLVNEKLGEEQHWPLIDQSYLQSIGMEDRLNKWRMTTFFDPVSIDQ